MADVAIVRKRVRAAIEQARRDQADRRGRVAEAQQKYDEFLASAAIPAFRMIANVLKSEGLNFEVMTPAGGVRLQSERSREDAIEMELDTTADPPQPLVTVTRVRGSRVAQSDRSIKGSNPLVHLTEDDVIEMLLDGGGNRILDVLFCCCLLFGAGAAGNDKHQAGTKHSGDQFFHNGMVFGL